MNPRPSLFFSARSLSVACLSLWSVACGGKYVDGAAGTGGAASAAGNSGFVTGGAFNLGGASAAGSASAGGTLGAGGAQGGHAGAAQGGTGGSATAGTPPSCARLPATCGPTGNESCCTSGPVPSGSFVRPINGQDFPATVSAFALDKYEITVGRFRAFAAVYTPTLIPAGAGKNPHNSADPGWDPTWDASMPSDAAALKQALECDSDIETWTDSPGGTDTENLPLTCMSWFEAEAFCIWDEGRLPTDAEWTYVAAGGAEQRVYPWGNATPDCTYANFLGAPSTMIDPDYCVKPGVGSANLVGSESPKGDSKWGQADMGGNISEWTQDYSHLIISPCNDCANLQPNGLQYRLIKGGSFFELAQVMGAQFREPGVQSVHLFGARCARAARN